MWLIKVGTALSFKKDCQMILPSLYSGVVASLKNWLLMWLSSFDKGCLLWATSAARVSRRWGLLCHLLPPTLTVGASGSGQQFILEHCTGFSEYYHISHKDCRYNGTQNRSNNVFSMQASYWYQAFPGFPHFGCPLWQRLEMWRRREGEGTWVQGFVVVRMNN